MDIDHNATDNVLHLVKLPLLEMFLFHFCHKSHVFFQFWQNIAAPKLLSRCLPRPFNHFDKDSETKFRTDLIHI